MQVFSVGDRVAVLGDTIKGVVMKVSSLDIEIEDDDGFLRSYPVTELVPQKCEKSYKIGNKIADKEATILLQKVTKKKVVPKTIKHDFPSEIDLHIEVLRGSHQYLTNYEIVQIQMTACRSFVQQSIERRKRKIVIIHGKGEGVLKSEIHHYLSRLSNNSGVHLTYHDASYQCYGMGGATEVILGA